MTGASLATLSFLAPAMAWGAVAAIALPLLAHLLSRTRYRPTVFPATRFVQQAVAATSRIETPRHRLLLLLRVLLLMLLVLAFMRPQWTALAETGDPDQGIALVILLDASVSMQRTQGGATLYDRANREAQALINALDPARDIAAVVHVDHAPDALLPEATAQFSLLVDQLVASNAGYTHANWPGAVAVSQRLASDTRLSVRYVTISDQQGEQPEIEFADGLLAGLDHLVIEGPSDNVAIRLLDVRPYPAVVGQPITASVQVRSYGTQPMTTRLVATLNGRETTQSLTLQPGTAEVRILRFDQVEKGGLLQVMIDQPDAIEADNMAGLWLPALAATRSIIVHDDNEADRAFAERVALLMNPAEVSGLTLPRVTLSTVQEAQDAVASADTSTLRTVVLLSSEPQPDPFIAALQAYTASGGGVVQFALGEAGAGGQSSVATGIDFDLQPLRVFEGPSRSALATLRWPGAGDPSFNAAALPILADERSRPIVSELAVGRGRHIVIHAGLGSGQGGLLAEPAFVVLFNELCRYASPGPEIAEPFRPGDAWPESLQTASRTLIPDEADPAIKQFTAPGAYAVVTPRGGIESAVWVQIDPAESDTSAPKRWSGVSGKSVVESANQAEQLAASLRESSIELWPYFVLGVIALIACESLLLWRFAGHARPLLQGGAR